ncbi:glucohydrolase, partial [Bifidobacteriaceae bacterium WP022]
MTTFDRANLPESVRTNGATPNPWWANAVVYQIYPRSFQDTNGDGIGDLKGITSRLDYLADLGVDVLWLSPVYKSPQDDNGYDISDYQDIDPLFGTLEDMDELLAGAHKRGLKVVMDLVVNHTSDEHAWFQASRDASSDYADWYWWRPAREGCVPGEPGAEPNKWGSYFGGSAWTYDPKRGEYFLHQYSPKQPDLNWENPAVRAAVYKMMNWWMDRGIDGFRMDVITQISKHVDSEGRLPGEVGCQIEDFPAGADGYSSPFPFCSDGPRLDEFLREMRAEVFEGREGFLTVGEAPGISPHRNTYITDPTHSELDMLFLFNHVDIDCENGTKWNPVPLKLTELKRVMAEQQQAVADAGWASLFFNNHDQPRALSRWGSEASDEMRVRSAKAIAMLLHMHRGTPYVYQGEEIGMTNAHFTRLEQYRDLEALNMFKQRVEEAHIQSAESMMDALAKRGRDNSRTPMQWNASKYAGFMPFNVTSQNNAEPWISVNPNYVDINAAEQMEDSDSVYAFYKYLIALRHSEPIVSAGSWNLV